jgi:hypothetical protein
MTFKQIIIHNDYKIIKSYNCLRNIKGYKFNIPKDIDFNKNNLGLNMFNPKLSLSFNLSFINDDKVKDKIKDMVLNFSYDKFLKYIIYNSIYDTNNREIILQYVYTYCGDKFPQKKKIKIWARPYFKDISKCKLEYKKYSNRELETKYKNMGLTTHKKIIKIKDYICKDIELYNLINKGNIPKDISNLLIRCINELIDKNKSFSSLNDENKKKLLFRKINNNKRFNSLKPFL